MLQLDRYLPRQDLNKDVVPPCDERFVPFNTMPRAASKFRNTEKTTVFATQSDRNDDAIINKNVSGQFYYGGNEIYLKPAIKGSTFMSLVTPRQTL